MIKAHVYEIEFPLFGGFSISLSLSLSLSLGSSGSCSIIHSSVGAGGEGGNDVSTRSILTALES